MKRQYKSVFAIPVILALGYSFGSAQVMPVTASGEGLELFLKAREAHQVSWFEKADDLFREAIAADPGNALAHAYASVLDYLLYRDPAARVARARELAEACHQRRGAWLMPLCFTLFRITMGQKMPLKMCSQPFLTILTPGTVWVLHRSQPGVRERE